MLVVGRRDKSRLRHLVLGSVADQCLRHAPCPTMIVPHAEEAQPEGEGPIVVGMDGSADAQRALHWALDEAQRVGRTVLALHCWQEPLAGTGVQTDRPPDRAALERSAVDDLDRWLARVSAPGTVTLDRAVRGGDPAIVLVDAGRAAGMLVLGSRGVGGFRRLLLGSVAHHAAHLAPCPVVVLPHWEG